MAGTRNAARRTVSQGALAGALLASMLRGATVTRGAEDDPPINLGAVAGVYYAAGPTGGSCRLELRPDGHYLETCFHGPAMAQHRGRVKLGRMRFALVPDGNAVRFTSPENLDSLDIGGAPGKIQETFLPTVWRHVAWGERSYLVTRSQLLEFCISVAEGSEPRKQRVGPFYLREGDEAKPAATPSPVRECQEPTGLP